MAPRVRIGVIGWNYPEWRGTIYEPHAKPAEFLGQYAARFPLVEAASAAYGMPRTSVVEAWAERTPADFEISLKVPDWIVRSKDPRDPDLARALSVLMDHLRPLSDAGKLGTLVAQFHPSFRYEKRRDDLARFVEALPEGPRWAVELRDASWWRDETYRLLEDAGVTLVWSELGNGFRTPPVLTTRAVYARLFGDRDIEPPFATTRRDAQATLAQWVERIQTAAPAVERVDVLVSKFLEGYAPATAETLAQMLGVPLLPADSRGPRQTTLV